MFFLDSMMQSYWLVLLACFDWLSLRLGGGLLSVAIEIKCFFPFGGLSQSMLSYCLQNNPTGFQGQTSCPNDETYRLL